MLDPNIWLKRSRKLEPQTNPVVLHNDSQCVRWKASKNCGSLIILYSSGVADIWRPTCMVWCSLLLSGIWADFSLDWRGSLLLRHNHHRAVQCSSQCDHRLLEGRVYDSCVSNDYGPNGLPASSNIFQHFSASSNIFKHEMERHWCFIEGWHVCACGCCYFLKPIIFFLCALF